MWCCLQKLRQPLKKLLWMPRVNQLNARVPGAWPNLFRSTLFCSRLRAIRSTASQSRHRNGAHYEEVDLLLVPSLRDGMLTISNFTGHPSLTLKTGSVDISETRSDWAPDPKKSADQIRRTKKSTLWRDFDWTFVRQATIARVGLALEKHFSVAGEDHRGFKQTKN